MEAIILTGSPSLSRRVQSSTANPMVAVHGKPILAHQLDYWMKQGVERFIFTIGKTSAGIREYFGRSYRGAEIDYVIETRPLGSGGSLMAAARLVLDDYVLLLTANSFLEIDLPSLKEAHRKRKASITCAVVAAPGLPGGNAIFVDSNHKIHYDSDQKTNAKLSGSYLIERTLFGKLPFHAGDSFTVEGSLLPAAIAAGVKVTTFQVAGTVVEPIGEETLKLASDIFGSLSTKAA